MFHELMTFLRVLLLVLSSSLVLACEDEDELEDPKHLCERVCARSRCPSDGTTAQCQQHCESMHARCPVPANVYHRCFDSQFDGDLRCDEVEQVTRPAQGLCVRERNNYIYCVREQ